MPISVAIAPETETEAVERMSAAVQQGGGEVTSLDAAEALVWLSQSDVEGLEVLLDQYPAIRWVQLPWAGVERFAERGLFERGPTFTCAKGAYGQQVGEHAVVLAQACLRQLTRQDRKQQWHAIQPRSLFDQRVTILGAGGIASTVIGLLQPYRCEITVLRRSDEPMAGASRTLLASALDDVLPVTDILILALALTSETVGIIGEKELSLLPADAVLVNVARGRHVDTDALVAALTNDGLFAAGLDVTEPEPLPADHPLWGLDQVIITSHSADSRQFTTEQLGLRVTDNLRRLAAGQPLQGLIDPDSGY